MSSKLRVGLVAIAVAAVGAVAFAATSLGGGGQTPAGAPAAKALRVHQVQKPGGGTSAEALSARAGKPTIKFFETNPQAVDAGDPAAVAVKCPKQSTGLTTYFFTAQTSDDGFHTFLNSSLPQTARKWLISVTNTDSVMSHTDQVVFGLVCAKGVKS
jgi:hypothetical protein